MPVYVKMMITAMLSVTAVILYKIFPSDLRKSCMIAMLLSSVGDVFMVNTPKIGEYSTFIGAGFFIAAHIVYGGGFYSEIRKNGNRIMRFPFWLGFGIMLLSAVLLGAAEFTLPEEKKPVMFLLILVYIAAIGYNVCSEFAFSVYEKKLTLILPFSVILFYITDVFIFLNMLGINDSLRQYVWYFYPAAQLMIILFNSPFTRKNATSEHD